MNNVINQEDKIFLTPGQIVKLKQDIPNSPIMIIHRVEKSIVRNNGKESLRGIKCRWFTKDGFLQEAIFSTKDLILVK